MCILPTFQTCCCCIPLRKGLVIWGYIKLFTLTALMGAISVNLYEAVEWYEKSDKAYYKTRAIVIGCELLFLLSKVLFIVIFLVGGHKKIIRLIRAYLVYGTVVWVLMLLLNTITLGVLIYSLIIKDLNNTEFIMTYVNIFGILLNMILEAYFLLLVRSEIVKLKLTRKATDVDEDFDFIFY